MDDTWRARLEEVLAADGRSMRAISLAAGFGPNFVQQMLKDRKDPSFPRLARVLSVLGTGATLYVTSGLRLSPEVETFLRIALSLDSAGKQRVQAAIDTLRSPSSSQGLSLDPSSEETATNPKV